MSSYEEKDQIAQEKYGKPYEELGTNEQKGVGGVIGGSHQRGSGTGPMSMEEKQEIAQEKYGKSYEELGTNEQKAVGGVKGGRSGHSEEGEQ